MGNARFGQGLEGRLRLGFYFCSPEPGGWWGALALERLVIEMPALSSHHPGTRAGFPSCAPSAGEKRKHGRGAPPTGAGASLPRAAGQRARGEPGSPADTGKAR